MEVSEEGALGFRLRCGAEWWQWDPFAFGLKNQSSPLELRPKTTRLEEPYLPAGFSTETKHSPAQQPRPSTHLYLPYPDRGNGKCAGNLLCSLARGSHSHCCVSCSHPCAIATAGPALGFQPRKIIHGLQLLHCAKFLLAAALDLSCQN